ncbi:VOC family protein [Cytobacillus solani]|uniref:Glyoxalase n=1 Tax=Cytobacillus solani TaxID=1637975 RepID=A0A0Q3SGJ9_9BACI|nr:VOC family protein [Cytobacillus solani]KOP81592.1 glyoxalase [Bacillus sp. FJAT-21945]KQL18532.1 glyoxalase [Cytobacillus solani]
MNFHREPNVFVSQVHLKVADLNRSITFYQQVIGFQLIEQTENKASLSADGKTALVTIEQPENIRPKQPRTTGLYHFALLLPSRSDLAKVIEHFIKIGYPLQGASDHLVSEALYLADPDGNGIEIYADRPSTTWKWNQTEVVMSTERLDIESILAEGDGKPWSGLPSDTIMGHIHLHVSELHKTEEFYCKGLGFDIVTRYGGQALFISTGRYHHHIGLNTWNGIGAPAPSENSVGLKNFTLIYPNEETRKAAVASLEKIGAAVFQENGQFMTEDPSGNRILLSL